VLLVRRCEDGERRVSHAESEGVAGWYASEALRGRGMGDVWGGSAITTSEDFAVAVCRAGGSCKA